MNIFFRFYLHSFPYFVCFSFTHFAMGLSYDEQDPSNHSAFGLVDLYGFQNIKQDCLSIYLEHFSYCCRASKGSLNQAFASSAVSRGSSCAMA
jgi:hypothetical protein